MQVEYLDNYQMLGRAVLLRAWGKELVITLDVGPRILRFCAEGYENVFAENVQEADVLPDGSVCHVYGGFRICHSPEAFPRSYISDSRPVASWQLTEDGLSVDAPPEQWTQMQKRLCVKLRPDSVEVQSGIRNTGAWPIRCAAWAISACAPGTLLVFPGSSEDTGYLPNRKLVLWPYTNIQDSRIRIFNAFHAVFCDCTKQDALKLGCRCTPGWAAAFVHQQLYIKRFGWDPKNEYPDLGCNFEAYAAPWGIEVESLSALQTVDPGQTLWHTEQWQLLPQIEQPKLHEAALYDALEAAGLLTAR